jgi:hypothetical protein
MRRKLFQLYAKLAAMYMFLWQKITGFLIGFIENSEKAHMAVLGWINRQALQLIHKESYDEVQEQLQQFNQVIEAKQMSLELKLLNALSQVRDHAKDMGDWTEQHSDALEAVGNALLNECDWEEESVHQYLKQIVESIEGLEYGPDGFEV